MAGVRESGERRAEAVAPEVQFLLDAERQARALRGLGYSIKVRPIEAAVDREIYEVAGELMAGYVELAETLPPEMPSSTA